MIDETGRPLLAGITAMGQLVVRSCDDVACEPSTDRPLTRPDTVFGNWAGVQIVLDTAGHPLIRYGEFNAELVRCQEPGAGSHEEWCYRLHRREPGAASQERLPCRSLDAIHRDGGRHDLAGGVGRQS